MARVTASNPQLAGIKPETDTLYPTIYPSGERKKAHAGTVKVEVFKGRLRLRWRYAGERYCLSLGYPDSKVNRTVAEGLARRIEGDLPTGNFDATLKKYKSETVLKRSQVSVVTLFEKFIQEKSKTIDTRTQEKYRATLKHLAAFFKTGIASSVGIAEAESFLGWLPKQNLSAVSQKTYLTLIKAAWEWGVKQNFVQINPWQDLVSRVKVPPKQKAKPFDREEIGAIIQAFRTDRYYNHYADFVEFMFGTGCRTGEAIGLRWKHLNPDCSSVWIGESLSRGVRKPTKTNRARTISLPPKLQALLLARKPEDCQPDSLVFTAPNGGAIDDHNFRNRAWKTVLTRLEIDYRKPYTTRHSLISHALDLGMNPVMVAELTGHDVQTLYRDYAGNVNSRPMLPEL